MTTQPPAPSTPPGPPQDRPSGPPQSGPRPPQDRPSGPRNRDPAHRMIGRQAHVHPYQGRPGGGGGPRRPRGRYFPRRRRICPCVEGQKIDYKDIDFLRRFLTDQAKVESRRKTGMCAQVPATARPAPSSARATSPCCPTRDTIELVERVPSASAYSSGALSPTRPE